MDTPVTILSTPKPIPHNKILNSVKYSESNPERIQPIPISIISCLEYLPALISDIPKKINVTGIISQYCSLLIKGIIKSTAVSIGTNRLKANLFDELLNTGCFFFLALI